MTTQNTFDLKDLMSQVDLNSYLGESKEIDETIKDLEIKRKEELRKKLRAKTNNMRNNRMSKDIREDNKLNALKESPLFQNLTNQEDMKKAIDMMASSFSKDSKQKKNIKKQMERLVEKIKEPEIA